MLSHHLGACFYPSFIRLMRNTGLANEQKRKDIPTSIFFYRLLFLSFTYGIPSFQASERTVFSPRSPYRTQSNFLYPLRNIQGVLELGIKSFIGADLNRKPDWFCHLIVYSTHWVTAKTEGIRTLDITIHLNLMLRMMKYLWYTWQHAAGTAGQKVS